MLGDPLAWISQIKLTPLRIARSGMHRTVKRHPKRDNCPPIRSIAPLSWGSHLPTNRKSPESPDPCPAHTAAAFASVPAISVPCGFSHDGLPIGLQIMAKRFDEEAVFRAAYAYEKDTPWHTMRPPVGDR